MNHPRLHVSVRSFAVPALLLVALWTAPGSARAEPGVAGVCPDGSFFVVPRREAAPCARPKFVPASELPPLKPQYLPRPYTWYLDQEERDENNPYNLVDKAQQIRALRAGTEPGAEVSAAGAGPQARTPGPSSSPGQPQALAATGGATGTAPRADGTEAAATIPLPEAEVADLVQLITLRQALAPAILRVDDVRGALELQIKLAYSPAFEARMLELLGAEAQSGRVIAFSVRSEQATAFYPRFFVTQAGASFRPDASRSSELGFVVGGPGAMRAGLLSVGYLVLPARFDLAQPLTLWWNDRSLETTLAPGS